MTERKPIDIPSITGQIEASLEQPSQKPEGQLKGNFRWVLSTGSTLLDLACSGGVVRGGGIPTGILIEIFGPSGAGKTTLLLEIMASALAKGGQIRIGDPEGRINKMYAKVYKVDIPDEYYERPDTVREMFNLIAKWNKDASQGLEVYGCDSTAALSTEIEMEKVEGDKMGGRQAKDFSAGFRKTARLIAHDERLVVFTNQIRQTMAMFGPKTKAAGGEAGVFYASLRLKVKMTEQIEREAIYEGRKFKKVVGIASEVYVVKSTIDEPYRTAPIRIMFNYGVDDIGANLQWVKDQFKTAGYADFLRSDGKAFKKLEDAITFVEQNGLQEQLRGYVIDLWEEIDKALAFDRKPKVRF